MPTLSSSQLTHGGGGSLTLSSTGGGGPSSTPHTPIPAPAPTSRARAPGARKRALAADDAAYHAAAGTKRTAGERADGDRERVKRKRVADPGSSSFAASGGAADREERVSLVDFGTLSTDALHRYLACFDLIPDLEPSPLGAEDAGQPSTLLKAKSHPPMHTHALRQASTASPGPGPMATAANRPRREPGASRRRSSRLVEEERAPAPAPLYGDLAEIDGVLAVIAERHFQSHRLDEVDTLSAFMCAVKRNTVLSQL